MQPLPNKWNGTTTIDPDVTPNPPIPKKKKRKSSLCRCKQLKAYKCNSRGKQRSRASKNGTGTTAAAGNNLVKCHLFPVLANSGRKHARSISANGWKIPRRDPNPRELSSLSLARGGSFQRISRRFIGRTSPGNNFRWWRDMWRARRRLSRHAAVISIRWPLYGRDIFPPFLSPPPSSHFGGSDFPVFSFSSLSSHPLRDNGQIIPSGV